MFGNEAITREILGNVPHWLAVLFYISATIACSYAALSFWQRTRSSRKSQAPSTPSPVATWNVRVIRVLRYLVFHEQLRRDPYAGWSHLLVVYGFFILFVGTCLVFLEHDTPLHFFYGWFYQAASLVIDLGGLAFLIGLSMFLARRISGGSTRILREWWVTALSGLLLTIGVSGFLLEAARIAIDLPAHEWCSIVGYPLAVGLRSAGLQGSTAVFLQQILWAGHAIVCIAFFTLLPWGFFGHMAYGLTSISLRDERRLSHLPIIPLLAAQPPGATSWINFSPRDLLQTDACTTCGRCNEVCPAAAAGKPLRPRDVVLELRRNHTEHAVPLPDTRLQLSDEVLWSCTTCAACNQACPVGIDVYDKIVDLRRGKVELGQVPASAEDVFASVAEFSNPFDRPNAERLHWARGLDVPVAQDGEPIETLYWIGCSGSFSPEGQSIARSMVKILNHLGVNYRVLGTAERCTGDPARRMGEEGLFQQCAAQNIRELQSRGVKRVITHCPHCYNTMRNEYPGVNPSAAGWQTQHHTEFLAEQMAAGKLEGSKRLNETVTFHDPCYLGRGNGIVREPREILSTLNLPIVEMPRHGETSFCCGAGGGSMWLDVRGSERIENQRYAEASATSASVIGTGCPFCKTMLMAARQASTAADVPGPKILDVAELVVMAEGL